MHLAQEPLCRTCKAQGDTTPATDVDHILSLDKGGTNAMSNLQSLCHAHHSAKTATVDRRRTGATQ
jgi:5-methylcytosine-specific restriction protein A